MSTLQICAAVLLSLYAFVQGYILGHTEATERANASWSQRLDNEREQRRSRLRRGRP